MPAPMYPKTDRCILVFVYENGQILGAVPNNSTLKALTVLYLVLNRQFFTTTSRQLKLMSPIVCPTDIDRF